MRDRDSGRGGHGAERGDSGHDLEGHAGFGQDKSLLASAPEDERVAALQTDDVQFCASRRGRVAGRSPPAEGLSRPITIASAGASAISSGATRRSWTRSSHARDEVEPARRNQPRVAGAGAHEVDGHLQRLLDERLEEVAPLAVGAIVGRHPSAGLSQPLRER